jgi:hypothetical protein
LVGTEAKKSKQHNPHKAATTEAGKGHGSKSLTKTQLQRRRRRRTTATATQLPFQFTQPLSILLSAV